MTFVPADPARRRWTWRLVLLGLWALYIVWLAVSGRASTSHIVTMALFVVGATAAFWVYDKWWNRPLPRSEGDAEQEAGPSGAPREIRHGMSFDLLFPIALVVTLVGTMALLGFPGGGAGAGITAIAAIALVGWLALQRAING